MEWNEVILADLKFAVDRDKERRDHSARFHSRRYNAWIDSSENKGLSTHEWIAANSDIEVIERNDASILAQIPATSDSRRKLYRLVRTSKDWLIDAVYHPCYCELDNNDATRRACRTCHGKGTCWICLGTGMERSYTNKPSQIVCEECKGDGTCKKCNGLKSCPDCSDSDVPGWWDLAARLPPKNGNQSTSPSSDAPPLDTKTIRLPNSLPAPMSAPDWMEPLIVMDSYGSQYSAPKERAEFHTRRHTDLLNRLSDAFPERGVTLLEQSESRILAEVVDLNKAPPAMQRLSRRYSLVREDGRWLLDWILDTCFCSRCFWLPTAKCGLCEGSGVCTFCKGRGDERYFFGVFKEDCSHCGNTKICNECKGDGKCDYCRASDYPGWRQEPEPAWNLGEPCG